MAKFYYLDGTISTIFQEDKSLHREDGPAIETDSSKTWYIDDMRHRLDGPAFETKNGYKSWWVNGNLHRLDGPSIEYENGSADYHIDGQFFSKEEFDSHPLVVAYKADKAIRELLSE